MTLATVTNMLVIILCTAVLVQTSRMMLAVRRLRGEGTGELVKVLDRAVAQSRTVLGELRATLATEGAAHAEAIAGAATLHGQLTDLRNELDVMIAVGNSVADRIAGANQGAATARDDSGPRSPDHDRADAATAGKEFATC